MIFTSWNLLSRICLFVFVFILFYIMASLLELDYQGRKAFAYENLKDIPEWSDVSSIDDFDMEQNKGIIYTVFTIV